LAWFLGFLIAVAVVAVVGHLIWLACAAIVNAISGGGPDRALRRDSPAPQPARRDQCPVCTAPFTEPSSECEICGWPHRAPHSAVRRQLAFDALRRFAMRFRRTEWLDSDSFQLVLRGFDDAQRQAAAAGRSAPIPLAPDVAPAAFAVAPSSLPPTAAPEPGAAEAETVLELVEEVAADAVILDHTNAEHAATVPESAAPPQSAMPIGATHQVADEATNRVSRFVAARTAEPVVEREPEAQHKPFSKILASFLEEKNIRWGELIGGLLIICSSIALVLSFWQPISQQPLLKFGLFNGVTAALFGIGLYVERRWRLPTTTHGILLIAVLLVPLNFLAIAAVTLDSAPNDAKTIGGELLSIALFFGLTIAGGRILVGRAGIHLAIGVVGASVLELLVRRFVNSTSTTEELLGFGLAPVLCFAIPTVLWARRLDRGWSDASAASEQAFGEPEANRLFKITGTTLFAALLPLAILLAKAGEVATTLTRIAPLVSLLGAPLLAVGLVLWRRLATPELMKERVAGTTIAVAGAMAMVAAVALGWPMPAGMLPTALINAAVFAWVAVRCGIPAAHLPAAICMAAAYLLGFHVLRGTVAWHGDDPHATLAALFSAVSGTALVAPAIFFALPAVLIGRRNAADSNEFAKWYAVAAGLTAAVSVALVAYFALGVRNDDAYATWVFALYTVGALAAAAVTGRAWIGYLGSALLGTALVQGICFRYFETLSAGEAWAYALLAHATISLIAMRLIAGRSDAARSREACDGAATPLFVGSALTSAAAAPVLLYLAFWSETLPAAIGLTWLTVVWGVIAWWLASPPSLACFQAVGFVAAIEWSHLVLRQRAWFNEVEDYPRILDPRGLAVYGLAAAGLCIAWIVVRLGLRRSLGAAGDSYWTTIRRDGARLVGGSHVTVDRVVLGSLVALVAGMAILAIEPGVRQELAPLGATSQAVRTVPALEPYELLHLPHVFAYGRHAWMLLAAVGGAIGLGMWERFALRRLFALLILAVAALLLTAARWETEVAAASAIRWGSVLLFIVCSLPLWFRRPTLAMIDMFGWPGWESRPKNLARTWFSWSLGLSMLPLVATAGQAVLAAVSRVPPGYVVSAALMASFVYAVGGVALSSILVGLKSSPDDPQQGQSWSLLGARLLTLSGAAPLAAVVLYAIAAAFEASPIVGPEPTSSFAKMGLVWSYVTPLLLLAGAFVANAWTGRSGRLAFAASILLNLAATIAFLLIEARTGLQWDARLWLRTAHLNSAVTGVFAIVWMLLERWRRTPDDEGAPPSIWMTTQAALGAALFAPAIVGPIGHLFLDLYDPTRVPVAAADGWAWGSFAVVLAAAVAWFRVVREPISVAAWSLSAVGAASLAALATIPHVVGDLVTFDLLVGGWLLTALGLAACGFAAEQRGWRFGPVRSVMRWSTAIGLGAFLTSQFGLIAIGVHQIGRSASATPHDFLASVSFLFAALCIGLAAWGPSRGRLYAAAITATYGALFVWFDSLGARLYPGVYDSMTVVVHVALIAWALPTPLWLAIERHWIVPRIGHQAGRLLPVLSRVTGSTSLAGMALLVAGGLLLDLQEAPHEIHRWLYAGAMATVFAAVATSLWDRGSKIAVPKLYVAGLTAVGAALDISYVVNGLDAQLLFFMGTIFTSAYALATSYLWSIRAGVVRVAKQVGMPTERWVTSTGVDAGDATSGESEAASSWLVAANYTLAVFVTFAAFRVILVYESSALRFSAAQAVFAAAVGVAFVAQGARRSSLQLRALEFGWIGAIAAAWSVLQPGETYEFLNRAVLAVTATAIVVALYGLGFSKLLKNESDWTAAAERFVPRLIAVAGFGLAVILAGEVFEYVDYGRVEIGPLAIGAVVVALVGLAAAAITAALVPGRDPLGLSERGRMSYVYGAEVILALLFLHVRLTMPWLFSGFWLRYWPVLVMLIAFGGVGLAEVFRRRKTNVLAEPLERTGAFLPLLPVLGFWVTPTDVHYSLLLLAVGLLYSTLAVMRKSFGFGILAALAANGGLWYFLAHQEGLGWLEHPQIWLIPPALCVLIAAHLNRSRLTEEQTTAYRYGAATTIYVASTADVFLNGVADAPMLPLILAALAIAGIFAGIALRVRAFLFLGTAFLLLALMTIIWHAAYDLEQTWIFYVTGIVAGVLIIALFAVFEKKRQELLGIVEKLRDWDA